MFIFDFVPCSPKLGHCVGVKSGIKAELVDNTGV